jgi:hypothetical protein
MYFAKSVHIIHLGFQNMHTIEQEEHAHRAIGQRINVDLHL